MRSPTLGVAQRFPALFAALVLGLSSCSGQVDTRPRVELEGEGRTTRVRVEIAETPEARERGLMDRTALDEDAGMLFVWPADAASSFHMKNTLIPLSIAFVSADGHVVRIIDMEPCRADPCPTYDPQTSYRLALEVRQGSFARWGIKVGDRVRVLR